MSDKKEQQPKDRLHIRNKNRERYDLSALIVVQPELKNFLKPNKIGVDTVDFSDPKAVKLLNTGLLNHYYGIENWNFPDENLCPPIPGRADYLHNIADLLCENNFGTIPTVDKITCLDIGTGASCIYPIIGVAEYGWKFIATDISADSLASAEQIIASNPLLKDKVECRLQPNPENIFEGILSENEKVDITICNPPFHASQEEADSGTRRKIKNLTGKRVKTPELNFSGLHSELIYEGGELQFIENMIRESKQIAKNCFWISTLVSKQSHLKAIYKLLNKTNPTKIRTIPMGTGNKSSQIVAWTYLNKEEQKEWQIGRWKTK